MIEALGFLVASFWAGAVHAATPGHGKTIAAAYIVGVRGRPVDAVILGIFVTLSHTSGIVIVALLASLGSGWLVPERTQAYLALVTGLMVVGIGAWMMWDMRGLLAPRAPGEGALGPVGANVAGAMKYRQIADHVLQDHGTPAEPHGRAFTLGVAHAHANAGVRTQDHARPHVHDHSHDHEHSHDHAHDHSHGHGADDGGWHSHGWGPRHTHRLDQITSGTPSLWVLLGLGIAGGLLPDPAALALLLAQLAQGKLMLGLGVVLLFSLGFAGTLVVVGAVAAKVGQRILDWMTGAWSRRLRFATAVLITLVGVYLSYAAWQTVVAVSR